MSRRKLYFKALFTVWVLLIPAWALFMLIICPILFEVIELIENPERRKPMNMLKRLDWAVGKILLYGALAAIMIAGILPTAIDWIAESD